MAEIKWACGCHEVDGKLEAQCTQTKPHGDVPAHKADVRYSSVCYRPKPVEPEAE